MRGFIDAPECIRSVLPCPSNTPQHELIAGSAASPSRRRRAASRAARSMVSPPGTQGLFKKAGSATIVDLNMLADIIAELPDAHINIRASKPDAA